MKPSVWRANSTDGTIRIKLPEPDYVLVVASNGEFFAVKSLTRQYLAGWDGGGDSLGPDLLNEFDDAFERGHSQQ